MRCFQGARRRCTSAESLFYAPCYFCQIKRTATREGSVLHAFYQVTIFTQNAKAHHLRNKSPLRSREIVAKIISFFCLSCVLIRDEGAEMDKNAGKSVASISSPSTSSATVERASTANARTLSTQDQNNSNNNDGFKRTLSIFDMVIYGLIFMVPIAPFSIYGGVANASNGMASMAYLIAFVECSSRCSHSAS